MAMSKWPLERRASSGRLRRMSEWRVGAARRRDARNTRSPAEVPKGAAANAKKNTKRWCRGKVGVEHKPKCVDYAETKFIGDGHSLKRLYTGWKLLVCTECGRELAKHWPIGSQKKNPPEWVKET